MKQPHYIQHVRHDAGAIATVAAVANVPVLVAGSDNNTPFPSAIYQHLLALERLLLWHTDRTDAPQHWDMARWCAQLIGFYQSDVVRPPLPYTLAMVRAVSGQCLPENLIRVVRVHRPPTEQVAPPDDAEASLCVALDEAYPASEVPGTAAQRDAARDRGLLWFLRANGTRTVTAFQALSQYEVNRALWCLVNTHHCSNATVQFVRRWMGHCKASPTMDAQGRWLTLYQYAPAHYLQQHPLLSVFPGTVAQWLWGTFADSPSELQYVTAFVTGLFRATYRLPQRGRKHYNQKRLALVLGQNMRTIIGWLQRARPDQPLSTMATMTLPELQDLLAEVAAYYNQRACRRGHYERLPATGRDTWEGYLLVAFNDWIAAGLFPAIAKGGERLLAAPVRLRMEALQRADPTRYLAYTEPVAPRVCPEITVPEADQLLRACRTVTERLYVCLSRYAAFRAGATASVRNTDLWDAIRQKPRDRITLTEKADRPRTVCVCAPLAVAIAEWWSQCGQRVIRRHPVYYVFAPVRCNNAHTGTPPRRSWITSTMRRLCRQGNIAPARPHHAWRRHLVSTLRGAGVDVDMVARYMAHTDTRVTHNSYHTHADTTTAAHLWHDRVRTLEAQLALARQQLQQGV